MTMKTTWKEMRNQTRNHLNLKFIWIFYCTKVHLCCREDCWQANAQNISFVNFLTTVLFYCYWFVWLSFCISFCNDIVHLLQLDENRCESCYGAETSDQMCCNTCEDVREAYRKKGWALSEVDNIKQVLETKYWCLENPLWL